MKIFQELEKKEKVPFWPSGRVGIGRIGRRAKFGPETRFQRLTRMAFLPSTSHDEKQDHGQHGQAGYGIFQDLVGPEVLCGT